MKHDPRTQRRQTGGFTLVEVALTIAMGLVIIAAAMTAFNVTKRNAITATQQNEAAAMKALVETAVARGAFPAWTTDAEVKRGLMSLVETANKNPYTGTPRAWGGGIGGYGACDTTNFNVASPILGNTCTGGGGNDPLAGGFLFLHTNSNTSPFTVVYSDGTQKTFQGWTFVETDMSGNIVAAVGGGIGGGGSSS